MTTTTTTRHTALKLFLTVIGLLAVIAALAGTKISQFKAMSASAADMKPPPASVATTQVKTDAWQPVFEALGTVVPVRGVELRAEVAGTVRKIFYDSSAPVKAGALLLLLDTSTQQAQLESARASAELGRTSYARVQNLKGNAAISESDVEGADARSKQANAEVTRLNAELDKRSIRAPFDGYLGIWQINLGQFLSIGDPITTVVSLDPLYVDFTLPEHQLSQLHTGLDVRVTTDASPGETFTGKISAVNPGLDATTRSVLVRATFSNPEGHLRPGMFAHVQVVLPVARDVLTIPQSAVLYAPYGDSVFIVDDKKEGKVVRQAFVRLGERRGDFVEITKGLAPADTIVMTGAFKLRNGMSVVVNNDLLPTTSLDPKPADN